MGIKLHKCIKCHKEFSNKCSLKVHQMFAREVMDSDVMNANQYLPKRTGLKNIKRANMVQKLTFVVNVARPMKLCPPPVPSFHEDQETY